MLGLRLVFVRIRVRFVRIKVSFLLGLELVFYINFGIVLGRLKFCFDILFLTSLYALALYDLTP